jgi:hypothetical protein
MTTLLTLLGGFILGSFVTAALISLWYRKKLRIHISCLIRLLPLLDRLANWSPKASFGEDTLLHPARLIGPLIRHLETLLVFVGYDLEYEFTKAQEDLFENAPFLRPSAPDSLSEVRESLREGK